MGQPFRFDPALPAAAYKTYAVQRPKSTHQRQATCEEVECPAWRDGWTTHVDVSTELGKRQAEYIAKKSGRRFHETTGFGDINNGQREFMFPPGQQCFREHWVPLEMEPIYVVRDGDWRGNPTGRRRVHANGKEWVEDFAEHQDHVNDQLKKG